MKMSWIKNSIKFSFKVSNKQGIIKDGVTIKMVLNFKKEDAKEILKTVKDIKDLYPEFVFEEKQTETNITLYYRQKD
jgi:hypothetical protein